MKKTILAVIIGLFAVSAQAGVLGVVKHLATDGFHVAKWAVVGVAHGVKHAAGDVRTVAK